MITYIASGDVVHKYGDEVVIVPTGMSVGYSFVDNGTLSVGHVEALHIWNAYNNDGVPTPYVFVSAQALDFACAIASGTQGVGPRLAASMVHTHGLERLAERLVFKDFVGVAAGVKGLSANKAKAVYDAVASKLPTYTATSVEEFPVSLAAIRAVAAVYGSSNAAIMHAVLREVGKGADISTIVAAYGRKKAEETK